MAPPPDFGGEVTVKVALLATDAPAAFEHVNV
jgi:hypothetical protein